MTKKNLKPQQAAPVQRENTAAVARDGVIAPQFMERQGKFRERDGRGQKGGDVPFAGDDAE